MPFATGLRRLWPRTIRRRLILGIGGLVAAVMAAFVYQTVARQREFLHSQNEERAIALTEMLAAASTSWVLANDIVGLSELVGSMRKYPGLKYVLIMDPGGLALGSTDVRAVGRYVGDKDSLSLLHDGVDRPQVKLRGELIDALVPIKARGVLVGWARVGVSQKHLAGSLVRITHNGVYFALAAIAVGTALAFAVARSLTRGLNELVDVTRKMARGDASVRARKGREDELGALSDAFNVMADALETTTRELREREDGLRRLIGSLPAAVLVFGPDGRSRYCNETARKLLHISADEFVGVAFTDTSWRCFNEDGSSIASEDLPVNRVIATREPVSGSQLGVIVGEDAEPLWLIINAYPDLDANGDLLQVIVSLVDVTEGRRHEKALREGEARLKEAQRVAHVGDWVWDVPGHSLTCSDELFRILGGDRGVRPERGKVSYGWLRQAVHPDDREKVISALANAIERREPYEITYRLLLDDGRIKHVDERCELLFDADGRPLRAMGAVHDVTARELAEEEVRKLNQELEDRVAKRTEALECATRDLEGFTYSVSHDLRTPLRAIDGYARMVLDEYGDKLDEEGQRRLRIVSQSAIRLGRLIDDLLSFAHLSRRKVVFETVDVESLVREVFNAARQSAPDRKILLQMATLPAVRGDRAMIRQVLTNLIDNAVKFTRAREEAVIEVGGTVGSDGVTYFIKDNGVGFDSRYRHKLFGVFQRLHSSDDFEGTGIGLAIVKGMLARQGGRVWAESREGEGAVFYFSFPDDGPVRALA